MVVDDHIKIKTNGMKISKFCEQNGCRNKGIIVYYCKTCNIHICEGCQYKLHLNHTTVSLDSFITDDNIYLEKKKINSDPYIKEIMSFIDKVESFVDESRNLINKKIQENKNISKFLSSLYNTYQCTKEVLNYNIINNIKINEIDDILQQSSIQFKTKLKSNLINILNENNFMSIYDNLNSSINQIPSEKQLNSNITNISNNITLINKEINQIKENQSKNYNSLIINSNKIYSEIENLIAENMKNIKTENINLINELKIITEKKKETKV